MIKKEDGGRQKHKSDIRQRIKDAIVTSFEITDCVYDPWNKLTQGLKISYVMPTGLERFLALKVRLFKGTGYPLQRYIDFFRDIADKLEADRAHNINREPEECDDDR